MKDKLTPTSPDQQAFDQQAFREIAEAFALLKENRDYIPASYYKDIDDIEASWFICDAQPFETPDGIRQLVPTVLAGWYARQEQEQEEEEEDAADEDSVEDDEAGGEADADGETDDDAETLAGEFRERCRELAEAIICVVQHDRCPKCAVTVLGDAVSELSNHQDETEEEEREFIKRACLKMAG